MTQPLNSPSCKTAFFISGDKLLVRMTELGLDEVKLASKAKVSAQTVRNYLNSSYAKPRNAKTKHFHRLCEALGVDAGDLQLELEAPTTPNEDNVILANQRFLADPRTVRSIAGKWDAKSVDLEIPGYVSYKSAIPWHGKVELKQYGNQFEAIGEDKDGDGVFARGSLMEDGNWLRFDYWIDNSTLREYGVAMVEFLGNGKQISGIFLGRDAGHSNIGLVIAHLTLTRCEAG